MNKNRSVSIYLAALVPSVCIACGAALQCPDCEVSDAKSDQYGDAWIDYMTAHITAIGEIERITGIDFLPGVTGSKRTEMERFKALELWAKE